MNKNLKHKDLKKSNQNAGFTLIELLVAMIISFLVITPLLTFMINILDTDRREQAKSNSEQEVQTAVDYIAQDLQQAIYIYDAKGIKAIRERLRFAGDTDRVPVLVFWKRKIIEDAIKVTSTTTKKTNDASSYSLVSYYLIKNNNVNNDSKIWSDQFRIARFEFNDGITDPDIPVKDGKPNYSIKDPDKGFIRPNSKAQGTIENSMNAWADESVPNYDVNKKADVLIDFVDASQDTTLKPIKECYYEQDNEEKDGKVIDIRTVPASTQADKKQALRIPAMTGTYVDKNATTFKEAGNGSFYACVNIDKVTATIFIRGNAYARINTDSDSNKYDESKKSFFPVAKIQVKGKSVFGGE